MAHAFIGIGLGIATFIVAAVLAWKERKEGDSDWKWALALAIVGLASSGDSVMQGMSADKAGAASEAREQELLEINKKIAVRADIAEKQLENLVAKANTRSEMLPQNKRDWLANLFTQIVPETGVFLVVNKQTGEADEFGKVMRDIFEKSGRLAGFEEHQAWPVKYGVTVMIPKSSPQSVARDIVQGLLEAGVPNVSGMVFDELPDGRPLQIEIGPMQ